MHRAVQQIYAGCRGKRAVGPLFSVCIAAECGHVWPRVKNRISELATDVRTSMLILTDKTTQLLLVNSIIHP